MQARIFLTSIFIPIALLTYSQEKSSFDTTRVSNHLNIKFYTGTIIPHDKVLNPLKNGIVKAFEVSYCIIKADDRIWRNYYNHPEVGISYMLMDLGYKDVLGYSHSVYPYIVFPFTKKEKPVNIRLRVALGLSYITKLYDSISNPKNIAISTPINMYASLGLELRFRLSKKTSATIGINASHFSNGSIKKPNYGLNIGTGNFGLNYNINQYSTAPKAFTQLKNSQSKWSVILSGGIKETKDPGGSKYGVGSLSIEYSKPIKALLRYGASFDYMYDGSTFVHFREDSVSYQSRLKASKLGLTLMGEMALYRLSLFGGLGLYLYNHDKQINPIYQRIGLRYRLNRSVYAQLALKTHFNVADYIEAGIGFKINSY